MLNMVTVQGRPLAADGADEGVLDLAATAALMSSPLNTASIICQRGSLGLVPGLESQIRTLKARVEELAAELDAKATAHQETLAKEIAEKEEYKKGNQIGQRLKFRVEQQDKELKALRPRVLKAEGEVSALGTQIATIEKEKQQLEAQLQELEAKSATQVDSARVRELESQLESMRTSSGEAGNLRERISKIQADLNTAQAALVRNLRQVCLTQAP